MLSVVGMSPAAPGDDTLVDITVRETNPASHIAESLVSTLGGTARENIELIGGFNATIPASRVPSLLTIPAIEAATRDSTVNLLAASFLENTKAAGAPIRVRRELHGPGGKAPVRSR